LCLPSKASDSKFSSSGRSNKCQLLKFANCQIIIMLINNAFKTTVDFKCGYISRSTIDLDCNFFCLVAKWGENQVGDVVFCPKSILF